MFDNAIPSYAKYLMKDALENGVLFEEIKDENEKMSFLKNDLNFLVDMSDDQKKIFKLFQQKLINQKQKYDEYFLVLVSLNIFFKFKITNSFISNATQNVS